MEENPDLVNLWETTASHTPDGIDSGSDSNLEGPVRPHDRMTSHGYPSPPFPNFPHSRDITVTTPCILGLSRISRPSSRIIDLFRLMIQVWIDRMIVCHDVRFLSPKLISFIFPKGVYKRIQTIHNAQHQINKRFGRPTQRLR